MLVPSVLCLACIPTFVFISGGLETGFRVDLLLEDPGSSTPPLAIAVAPSVRKEADLILVDQDSG
jgi:hypothetical protein